MKKKHLFLSVAVGMIFLSSPLLACDLPVPPPPTPPPVTPPPPVPISNTVPVVNVPSVIQVGQIGSNAVNVTGLHDNRQFEEPVYANEKEPSEKEDTIATIDNSEAVELAPKNPRN
ncbi:hypothetical protein [Chlorobium sp.]|uniref:hypothetical protein n=1 Tax=Chlorobium sp. TaxID=1095 RepID=UPI003C4AF80E